MRMNLRGDRYIVATVAHCSAVLTAAWLCSGSRCAATCHPRNGTSNCSSGERAPASDTPVQGSTAALPLDGWSPLRNCGAQAHRPPLATSQIEELFLRYDLNHDGHINFKEFVHMMSSPPWVKLFPRSAGAALEGPRFAIREPDVLPRRGIGHLTLEMVMVLAALAGDMPESPGSESPAEPKSPIRTAEVAPP